MEVTEGDPALLARLEKEPAPFDCDTFEADAMSLASSTPAGPIPSAERVAVTYPGPFKLLVLKDGSIVRRGDPVSLPIGPARELERSDGALVDSAGSAPDPQNYLALYRERGPACLLPDRPGSAAPRKEADLRALGEITPEMKRRLQTLISRGDEYFVLTGSDPAQKDGCCPSNDVGEANRLAAAGILESWGAAANSDCPTNIYAFAGEIRRDGPRPAFAKNEALRGSVKERLERTGFGARVLVRLALLAILLAGLAALAWALLLRSRC